MGSQQATFETVYMGKTMDKMAYFHYYPIPSQDPCTFCTPILHGQGLALVLPKNALVLKETQWHIYIHIYIYVHLYLYLYIWYMPSHLAFMALMVVLVFMAFMAGMAFMPLINFMASIAFWAFMAF